VRFPLRKDKQPSRCNEAVNGNYICEAPRRGVGIRYSRTYRKGGKGRDLFFKMAPRPSQRERNNAPIKFFQGKGDGHLQ